MRARRGQPAEGRGFPCREGAPLSLRYCFGPLFHASLPVPVWLAAGSTLEFLAASPFLLASSSVLPQLHHRFRILRLLHCCPQPQGKAPLSRLHPRISSEIDAGKPPCTLGGERMVPKEHMKSNRHAPTHTRICTCHFRGGCRCSRLQRGVCKALRVEVVSLRDSSLHHSKTMATAPAAAPHSSSPRWDTRQCRKPVRSFVVIC